MIFSVLSTTLGASPGSKRRDDAELTDLVGRDADRPAARARFGHRLVARAAATAKGMIFTVAIISPSTTGLKAASVASVTASSMRLRRSIAVRVDHQHAGGCGEQIAAAGEGAVEPHPLARHRLGDLGGGLILRDVARLELRHHHLGDAGGA